MSAAIALSPALKFGLACAGALLFCLLWLMWAIDRCTRCRCGFECHAPTCPQYDPLDEHEPPKVA